MAKLKVLHLPIVDHPAIHKHRQTEANSISSPLKCNTVETRPIHICPKRISSTCSIDTAKWDKIYAAWLLKSEFKWRFTVQSTRAQERLHRLCDTTAQSSVLITVQQPFQQIEPSWTCCHQLYGIDGSSWTNDADSGLRESIDGTVSYSKSALSIPDIIIASINHNVRLQQ